MSDVTVIGLGEMGSALAAAFMRGGRRTTMWNRSGGKAERLILAGALAAESAAAAVAASPVTVICVSDYPATQAILQSEGMADVLAGRTIVQLSTGTPKEARDLDRWVTTQGSAYLDGAILAWPRQIGEAGTTILTSGSEDAFKQTEKLLRALAGNLTFTSSETGRSAALFAAMLSYLAGHWIGFCQGALVCEAKGISVATLGSMLGDFAPVLGIDSRHMGDLIENGRYADPESALKTAGEDIGRLVQHAAEAGISAEVPRFAAAIFRRAIDAGHGAEEHAAIIKVMRTAA
jgi:3-hydroxyisobutyrate dehydrogenase-like beta-hydroxyacid dehydrogenase